MAHHSMPPAPLGQIARRALPIAFAILVSLAALGTAQLADTFILQEPTNLGRANRLFRLHGYGRWTSIATTMPSGWAALHATMDERNAGLLVCGVSAGGGGLFRVQPGAAPTSFGRAGLFQRPVAAVLDESGDWLVGDVNVGSQTVDLYRVDRAGAATSLGQLANQGLVRMVYDPEAGQALVLTYAAPRYEFLRIDPATWTVTTFTRTAYPFQPATITDPIYRPESGGFVFSGQSTTAARFPRVYEVTPESGAATVSTVSIAGRPLGMARYRDRMAPDVYALLLDDGSTSGRLVALDRQGVVTSTYATAGTTMPGRGFMVRVGDRALARRAPARGLSFLTASFPFERGATIAFGISFGGSRPGTPLVDGRTLPLNADVFTLLGLTNALPTVLGGMLQPADAQGRATATVDVRPFLAQLSGLRLTAIAVALDPRAPSGIAEISTPLNIRL